ncbi:hypothetical protein GCM10007170_18320 [Arthrobacter liuii]|uniref:Lipoprotein n=1 Tax=Arthrobacter liuii TaxID=1476996 RepID=A0ABQ2AR16_9MICC|nr:hypothetical protein GCM10007170_18320 [Arthrobacter liuii]
MPACRTESNGAVNLLTKLSVAAAAAALLLSGCAAPAKTADVSQPTQISASASASATPSPTADPDRDMNAALILKKTADVYRQRMAEAHGYAVTKNTEALDTFWLLMTDMVHGHGRFVSLSQRAYSDASDLYGEAPTPAALDDWDDVMDANGPLVTHATLWREAGNEAEYQATLNVLDQADRLANQLSSKAQYTSTPLPPLVPGA